MFQKQFDVQEGKLIIGKYEIDFLEKLRVMYQRFEQQRILQNMLKSIVLKLRGVKFIK